MTVQHVPQSALEDIKINVKLKLATLWASLMFLYIYIDNFHFYMPNKILGNGPVLKNLIKGHYNYEKQVEI